MVEKLEINFSLAKNLYKACCTKPVESYQIHVNTFVEVGGRNFESLLNQILRFTECLLEVAESFQIIQESHKPEVKVIHSNDFHVLLRWIFHILALVGSFYLSQWDRDLHKRK